MPAVATGLDSAARSCAGPLRATDSRIAGNRRGSNTCPSSAEARHPLRAPSDTCLPRRRSACGIEDGTGIVIEREGNRLDAGFDVVALHRCRRHGHAVVAEDVVCALLGRLALPGWGAPSRLSLTILPRFRPARATALGFPLWGRQVNSCNHKKKGRGRPVTTGKGTLIGVRLLDMPLATLDAWIADQNEPDLTRPEAIRRLVEIGLRAKAK